MTNKDAKTGPGSPGGSDPLSATGMFLRALENKPGADDQAAEPTRIMPAPTGAPVAEPQTRQMGQEQFAGWAGSGPAGPTPPNVGSVTPDAGAPGEFTRLFQALDAAPPRPPINERDTAVSAGATAVLRAPGSLPAQAPAQTPARNRYPAEGTGPQTGLKAGSQAAPDAGPGEFTRIFVGGDAAGSAAGPGRSGDDPPKPAAAAGARPASPSAPAGNPSKAKGFSSPGLSDSASGEGSFTQFFKAASPTPSTRPAQVSASPSPPAQAPPSAPAQKAPRNPEAGWGGEPVFQPVEKPPAKQDPSPSVTSLINSLAAGAGTTPRTPDAAPYRPEPLPSAPAPARPSEPAGMDAGGVTRLIQRLAAEQAAAPVAPPPPVQPAAPVHTGPGEFTRMISGLGAGTPPAAPGAPAAAAPAPPPAFAPPPPPAIPQAAFPPAPAAPKPTPPPAPAMAAPAVAVPAAPKPAPPPALAAAAPKGKLEAMVPVLLVINTFLLLLILVVMIFLIKGH